MFVVLLWPEYNNGVIKSVDEEGQYRRILQTKFKSNFYNEIWRILPSFFGVRGPSNSALRTNQPDYPHVWFDYSGKGLCKTDHIYVCM